jgi:hypothetical protein
VLSIAGLEELEGEGILGRNIWDRAGSRVLLTRGGGEITRGQVSNA